MQTQMQNATEGLASLMQKYAQSFGPHLWWPEIPDQLTRYGRECANECAGWPFFSSRAQLYRQLGAKVREK